MNIFIFITSLQHFFKGKLKHNVISNFKLTLTLSYMITETILLKIMCQYTIVERFKIVKIVIRKFRCVLGYISFSFIVDRIKM